jgi:hypothetical protein
MISLITMPEEDQDEAEELSLLSDLLCPQPKGGEAAEDLWKASL